MMMGVSLEKLSSRDAARQIEDNLAHIVPSGLGKLVVSYA